MTVAVLDVRANLAPGQQSHAADRVTSSSEARAIRRLPLRGALIRRWQVDRRGSLVCVWLVGGRKRNSDGGSAGCEWLTAGVISLTAGMLSLLALSGPAHGLTGSGQAALPATAIVGEAQEDSEERFAIHLQTTYVEQQTSGFTAPYSGPNSLSPRIGRETVDITLFAGARPWSGAEFWINPEIDQGFGLNNTLGVAGFPSGEAYKVGRKKPYFRLQRAFVRQTLDLDAVRDPIEGTGNQLAGQRSANRLVFTMGKFGVTDVFDANQYAHDPRGDFLNWAAVDAGSFDYAADAWGYTVGAAAEWYQGVWTLRGGVFDLSNVPNSEHLEPGFHQYQLVTELEKRHEIRSRPGKVLLTVFDTRGRMGSLDEAVRVAQATGNSVDIAAVRRYRSRLGVSVNLEQQLTSDLGVFARAGKAAGNVESYEFTDIDRTVSAGLSLKGSRWRRTSDTVGLSAIVNGISAARERFLNAGGLGILVGDGRLPHPGSEQIVETYYDLAILVGVHLTLDYQWVNHPAYNRDRGPVSIVAVRLHAQI